jgi:alpha-ketoglutarate-dependent taurine dioxygenase
VMRPANAFARRTLEDFASAIGSSEQKVNVSWERTSCVVLDNWQVLHARSAAPTGELTRVLFRIYVQ